AVFARFEREPDTLAIPVVVDGKPVGLVERDAFLIKLGGEHGRAVFGRRPIAWVMDDEPVVVEAATHLDAFCDSMLSERASSLMRGFIVTENGRYVGVGTALSLLQAAVSRERRRADEAAEQARRLADVQTQALSAARTKSQFLSVMSHELRTPMNGVLAVAELLRRQPLNADAQAYVQTIVESSETLLRILQDTLDLSRAEAGELELTPSPTMVREIMDEVQATWAPRAAQDGVTLLIGYEGDTELAAALDGPRLKQVFNNLVGNALKFARDGVVEASLKAWTEGSSVRIEGRVRDNGPGVSSADLDAIFQPFVHAGQATGSQSGAGLGLPICRQIVERMNGRIWAETNPGQGSTFAFDLTAPTAHVDAEPQSNVSEISELQLQEQPHILIVDDNATNRVVAQALCEMFGCTSECVEDGLEALQAVQTRRFDMVLMDIKMPRMDGVEATKAIRALTGPERDLPIVALTANADPDDARHYVSIGMAAVVEKPIKPDRLRHAMNAALAAPSPAVDAAPETQLRSA
ncbi:MAG TPA: ATP-binding protein, partial [Caulobacteraceae bacterium]